MIPAVDPTQILDYVIPDDDEPQTTFKIKVLSAREKMQATFDQMRIEENDILLTPDCMERVLRAGLRGWEGFPVPWNAGDMDANLDALPSTAFQKIAWQILVVSTVDADTKKNSESPAESPP